MTVYGSAIVRKDSRKILDVDLEHSRVAAVRLVENQNRKESSWNLRTEWVVVKIEEVEA